MIRVQDVKFRYDPEQPTYAVDGVSLNVRRGEFVAVLGANGCGKSTLAKHFNAILLPTGGKVWVYGMLTREIVEMSYPARSATSLRIIGRKVASSPVRKKSRCKRMIVSIVRCKVS